MLVAFGTSKFAFQIGAFFLKFQGSKLRSQNCEIAFVCLSPINSFCGTSGPITIFHNMQAAVPGGSIAFITLQYANDLSKISIITG